MSRYSNTMLDRDRKNARLFREAWARSRDPKTGKCDNSKFPLNLVGVQIQHRVSDKKMVQLPATFYGRCLKPQNPHAFTGREHVFVHNGQYMCPVCGYPIKRFT